MMAATVLQGLTGLLPDPQDTSDVMDEGVLEAKAFDLDPEHETWGSQSTGYSGTVPTQSPFSDFSIYDAGASGDYGGWQYELPLDEINRTPTTHSATYPRGIIQPGWQNPDAWATVGQQIEEVHSQDLGGPKQYNRNAPGGHESPVQWTADDYEAPDETVQAATPGQVNYQSGWGEGRGNSSGAGGSNADPVQGYGVVNTMAEFNRGHSIRNVQHDKMPMDYTNTHGEQNEPFWGRHPVQQMSFDGPDSPYFSMGDIDGANIPYVIGYPTPYVQPPEPTIIPATQQEDVWTAW